MTLTRDDALVGRVLDGRYRVGERIARGGMASVFHGHDERLDRPVAIKVMHAGLGDDQQFTERFEREAKAAARLNHRGVVSVFDQGHDGDVTYLVMEYVPGRTLRDVLRDEAPLPPRRALAIIADVLAALSSAHAAHLVHRDIKPENVLMSPDGDVKVADFGLARAVTTATTATGGTLIGTVSYMAPEIVVHESADARSDVYSCGALLYEMLTGAKPHTGESPIQVAYKHVHEDVAAPSSVQPGIPPYLDALVARATVRDRSQRSPDAGVLLRQVRLVQRALDEGLEDDPDLTADLMPRPHDPDTEQTRPVTGPAAPFAAVAGADAAADTGSWDHEVTEQVGAVSSEHTMRWSSGEWSEQPATASGYHPQVSQDDYAASRGQGSSSRRGRVLLIALIALAVALAGFGYWLGIGRYVDAPQLVGQSETQAAEEAVAAGFEFEVGRREYSESAPLGTVMSTDPEPGERALPGSTIMAVVSQGKERYAIPDLTGESLDAARAALEELNLKVGKTSQAFSEKIPEGAVVKVANLEVGEQVKRDTAVDLVISKGREPIEVPDTTGQPRDEAVAALEGRAFKVSVSEQFSDDVDDGRVLSQDPASGTKFRGDTIAIVVSKGPEEVKVPNTVGDDTDEAVEKLEKAGFEVDVQNRLPGDKVRLQTPGSGKAKVGSTVTIYV